MRAVVQRVKDTFVFADGQPCGTGKTGLLVMLGVTKTDTEQDSFALAQKICRLRVFSDENGKINRSLSDVGGTLFVISNFTLYADYRKGNRPDFFSAAPPEMAKRLYLHFIKEAEALTSPVVCGVFGSDMQIDTLCDGPVTIVMDSEILIK